jgi:hypothetical protein
MDEDYNTLAPTHDQLKNIQLPDKILKELAVSINEAVKVMGGHEILHTSFKLQ